MTQRTDPPTLQALLFDADNRDIGAAVLRALREDGVTDTAVTGGRRISTGAWRFLRAETTKAVEQTLQLDLGDLLVAAWRKHADLATAAKTTLTDPDQPQLVVDLATHRLVWTAGPRVDLLCDNQPLARVPLQLKVTIEFKCFAAVVRAGRLVALDAADTVLTAALTVKNVPVKPRSRRLDLGLVLPIPRGGLLLVARDDPTVTVPKQAAPPATPDDAMPSAQGPGAHRGRRAPG